MKNTTIKISFENDFLERIDEAAVKESRSRSELIREATRMYLFTGSITRTFEFFIYERACCKNLCYQRKMFKQK
jgi:hypothetical protein